LGKIFNIYISFSWRSSASSNSYYNSCITKKIYYWRL